MNLLTVHGVPVAVGTHQLNAWERIQLYAGKSSVNDYLPVSPVASFTLTRDQQEAFGKLQRFLSKSFDQAPYFVLGGYAGTGKSFLLQTLLGIEEHNFTITATNNKPTKVLAKILGRPASTVYSALKIRMEQNEDKLELKFPERLPVNLRGTVLVVDEASMIASNSSSTFVTWLSSFVSRSSSLVTLRSFRLSASAGLVCGVSLSTVSAARSSSRSCVTTTRSTLSPLLYGTASRTRTMILMCGSLLTTNMSTLCRKPSS